MTIGSSAVSLKVIASHSLIVSNYMKTGRNTECRYFAVAKYQSASQFCMPLNIFFRSVKTCII